MRATETRTSQLSFFGRLADDLTRKVILPPDMIAVLEKDGTPSLKKSDGYFAFADLAPSSAEYRIQVGGTAFQNRTVAKALPSVASIEVTFAGEDELYLTIVDVTAAQSRVTFDPIDAVPPVEAGAVVLGQSGFSATLVETLEGPNLTFAVLSSVAGLAANQLVRIIRSKNLLVRPGPYYSFPAGVTVVALKVVAGDQDGAPIPGARIDISKINGSAGSVVDVAGLNLNVFDLGGGPRSALLLDDDDKTATTNERGDAVFYIAGAKSITSVVLTVSKSQFQSKTQVVNMIAETRNTQKIGLAGL